MPTPLPSAAGSGTELMMIAADHTPMTRAPLPQVELREVWKLYGPRRSEALAVARAEGLGREAIRERFGCTAALVGVDLAVAEGEIFCVMGLSGSGKSTLVRTINRLAEPDWGSVRVDGEDVLAMSGAELRALRARRIGMVFQHFGLLPHRSVRDNVALPLEIQGMRRQQRYDVVEEALARVNLGGWGERRCEELSGGMQQRVGLARALVADPSVLLMDEPFSALDPLIRRQLQDEFVTLAAATRKTVVFITHDLREAMRIGQRIAIMQDGVILQVGTAEDLLLRPASKAVERFVAEVPRLELLSATSIMEPLQRFRARNPSLDVDTLPCVGCNENLSAVARVAAGGGAVAVRKDGETVGVIEPAVLLGAIGRESSS